MNERLYSQRVKVQICGKEEKLSVPSSTHSFVKKTYARSLREGLQQWKALASFEGVK